MDEIDEPEEGFVHVKFMAEALDEFRKAFPDMPPADEVIMKVRLGECGTCGKDMYESEIGGIDPVGITPDGELMGVFVCDDCMKKGR